MCCRGLPRPGRCTAVVRSVHRRGNSGDPACSKTSSSSIGTSPASNSPSGRSAPAGRNRPPATAGPWGWTLTVTRYGVRREPCTCAAIEPGGDVQGHDLPGARVASARWIRAPIRRIRGRPRRGGTTRTRPSSQLAARGQSAFHRYRGGRGELAPRVVQASGHHSVTSASSGRSATAAAGRRCSGPSTRPPRYRPHVGPIRACCSIISSIVSSSVPAQMNLCTCTLRVWPMRKARSVA